MRLEKSSWVKMIFDTFGDKSNFVLIHEQLKVDLVHEKLLITVLTKQSTLLLVRCGRHGPG